MRLCRIRATTARSALAAAALVLATGGLAACGSSSSAGPAVAKDYDHLAAAGKKEKTIVVYSALADDTNAALVKAFNKEYPGIKVQVTRLISSDLSSRFASETQSGASSADLLMMTDSVMFDRNKSWFLNLPAGTMPNLAKLPSAYSAANWFTAIVSPYVLTYNKNMVTAPPKTWKELADPKYAGKETLADPHTSDSVNAFWEALKDAYGDSFLTSLGKQNKDWYASAAPSVQTVAAGQYALSAPTGQFHSLALRQSGAPVDYVMPTPVVGFATNVAVAKAAEHPNAALLFANFLLTPEAQNAYCGDDKEGMTVIKEKADKCATAPADFTVVDPARAAEDRDKILDAFGLPTS